jgi:hypothetical protein
MSDTARTENPHVAAIRDLAVFVGAHYDGKAQDDIEHHADALARELAEAREQLRLATIDQANTETALAEAEARAARLQWRIDIALRALGHERDVQGFDDDDHLGSAYRALAGDLDPETRP